MFTNPTRRSSLRLITTMLFITPAAAFAQTTWYVDVTACPNAGTGGELDPFCKIQEGINAAAAGDTVLIAPGTYDENIDFLGKEITVRSEGGPELTTIDGNGRDESVVTCVNGEGPATTLDGFTITRGRSRHTAAAMDIRESTINVRHCVFLDNWTQNGGGVVLVYHGEAAFVDCDFISNSVGNAQLTGGILSIASTLTLQGCNFDDNRGFFSGAVHAMGGQLSAADCTFTNNYAGFGGALTVFGAQTRIDRCSFVSNRAGSGGAIYVAALFFEVANTTFLGNGGNEHSTGSAVYSLDRSHTVEDVRLTNCTVVGNGTSDGGETIPVFSGRNITLRNSIVWDNFGQAFGPEDDPVVRYSVVTGGHAGEGNIDTDPLFIDLGNGGLRLREDSPCIDAGDNEAIAGFKTDLDDNPRIVNDVVDMGAYEFQPRAIEVRIDVRPGNDVNPVKLGSRGVLPIAILSSESFDALTVDPSTVLVAGAGVALRGNGRRYVTVERDVNHDDFIDLVVHVETAGVETEADTFKIALTAQTYDGTPIFGTDTVRTVGR